MESYASSELRLRASNSIFLQQLCSEIMISFKILSVYLMPVLPETVLKVADFLNLETKSFNFDSILDFYPLENHASECPLQLDRHGQLNDKPFIIHKINPYHHLMKRVVLDKLSIT